MLSPRHPPADADDILLFLKQVMKGEAVHAALDKNASHTEAVFPTLDQRLRATLTLLGKLDTMQKHLTDETDAGSTYTFTAKDIEDMRAAMLGKLAGLAAPERKKRGARKPRTGGGDAPRS
jgi:hypothetical protein